MQVRSYTPIYIFLHVHVSESREKNGLPASSLPSRKTVILLTRVMQFILTCFLFTCHLLLVDVIFTFRP
jgi:hypothetical protein